MMHSDLMAHPGPGALFLIFFLYVETHFRIGRMPSRYFKKMPEILFDLPHRIGPDQDLPLLLFIKDAHLYPVELLRLEITLKRAGETLFSYSTGLGEEEVRQPFWWRSFSLPLRIEEGAVEAEPILIGRRNGQDFAVRVDNYPTLSQAPLKLWIDGNGLPGRELWSFGDLHYHSHLTSDQVEFGAPPEAAALVADAMGLEFLAVTDHSYDLDDCWDDYLRRDASLEKWQWLQEFTRRWNGEKNNPVIIPGEELSAGNSRGRTVHFLLLNEPLFFPGWGDSAEKWFQTRPQWSIGKVLERLGEKSLAFAGHAESRPPRLQRLFLGRDHWRPADYEHPRLNGVQMWNSLHDASFERGLATWRRLLLSGRRPVLIGGNDAHGDFGRWRQVTIPHLSLQEKEEHLFGQIRTGILRPEGKVDLDAVLQALRGGRCMITSGPSAWMALIDETGQECSIGSTCLKKPQRLLIRAGSSSAYGPLTSFGLCIGDLAQKQEIRKPLPMGPADSMQLEMALPANELPGRGYLRLEVTSERDGHLYRCFTNPVYLNWP
jgi:hypothetical protein